MFSRDQLKRAATLTKEDLVQLGKCRRPHNRLGFVYPLANGIDLSQLEHVSPSNGTMSCSTANMGTPQEREIYVR